MNVLAGPSLRADYLALLVLALSGGLWTIIARFARWRAMALASLFPFAAAVWVLAVRQAPLDGVVVATWAAFFVIYLSSLRWLPEQLPDAVLRSAHVAGAWLFVLVGMLIASGVADAMERAFAIAQYPTAWHWLGWALAPSLYLWLAGGERGRFWPLGAFEREYRLYAALPMMIGMLLWFWMGNLVSNGDSSPLLYIPLFNPFELGLLLVLAACWRWSLVRLPAFGSPSRKLRICVGVAGGASLFAFVTLAVCRGVASVWKLDFQFEALSASMAVQAGWSLVWALYALTLMIGGSLRKSRGAWLTGVVLVAIVVLKLLIVDLGDSLARIISFIGVGLLLLVVGYFAPLPPKVAEREEKGENA